MRTSKRRLRKILRKVLVESGIKASGDSFGDVVGGRYNTRGRMIPSGGSEIHHWAQDAWDFINEMGAPNVSPSFWEDGKLMRFSVTALEKLLESIMYLSGPRYEAWEAGAYGADEFIEGLEDHIALRKELEAG